MTSPHIHVPFDRIQQYRDFIRDRRLNLEIYFSAAMLDSVSAADVAALGKTLEYGPCLSIHAPFMDLSPGAVDEKVRTVTISRFNAVLDHAAILQPKTIVFHSGYEKWKYALKPEIWLEKSLLTWEPLIRRAEEAGTIIAVENIFEDEPGTLGMLMDRLGSDRFGICFDTGHCNLFSKVSLDDWMEVLNPHIKALHLHDNDRSSDQHLPVGDGSFDFSRFFRLLAGRDCVFTLEAHSPDHVIRSIENLKRFLNT